MSEQCRKCLEWIRDSVSENGVDIFICDTCGWEAPLMMCDIDMGAYPKDEFEDWAYLQYLKSRLYERHLIPKPNIDEVLLVVADCDVKNIPLDIKNLRSKSGE